MHNATWYSRVAKTTAHYSGRPWVFAIAAGLIVVWLVSGPLFGFSDTWQLVINTGTTIVTFLMVFLIQCMQNRDTAALQLKLDELLRAIAAADNDLIEVEQRGERGIEHLREKLRTVAEHGADDTAVGAGG